MAWRMKRKKRVTSSRKRLEQQQKQQHHDRHTTSHTSLPARVLLPSFRPSRSSPFSLSFPRSLPEKTSLPVFLTAVQTRGEQTAVRTTRHYHLCFLFHGLLTTFLSLFQPLCAFPSLSLPLPLPSSSPPPSTSSPSMDKRPIHSHLLPIHLFLIHSLLCLFRFIFLQKLH